MKSESLPTNMYVKALENPQVFVLGHTGRSGVPFDYDEVLTVRVSLDEMPTAKMVIRSEVFNEKGALINRGSVTLGFMHADTRRACRAPEWFMSALNQYIEKQNNLK